MVLVLSLSLQGYLDLEQGIRWGALGKGSREGSMDHPLRAPKVSGVGVVEAYIHSVINLYP